MSAKKRNAVLKKVSSNGLMVEALWVFKFGWRVRCRGGRGCGWQRGVARIIVVGEINEEGLRDVVGGIVGCCAVDGVVIEIVGLGLLLVTGYHRRDLVIDFYRSYMGTGVGVGEKK